MSLASDFNLLFLNVDLGREFTGIESAAMIRGRAMDLYLDLPAQFVSLYFNPMGHANFRRFQKQGLVSPRTTWVNLFDWIQGIDHNAPASFQPYVPPDGCVLAAVDGTPHDQRLYRQGQVWAYLKFDDLSGRLLFINYLRDGKIWKRDWMGADGRIRRTDFVDPIYDTADPVLEYFWGPDGSPVLIRDYEFTDKKHRTMRSMQRLEHGRVSQVWSDGDDLLEYFLGALLAPDKVNVLVLDRSSEFGGAAQRLKAKRPDSVKLVGMIHNTHYVHGIHSPGHPMTSELSSFYKDMLVSRDPFDALIFLTEAQKNDVQRRLGSGPYHVIAHACRGQEPPRGLERQWHRIVVPGRFAEEKQPLLAIQAFALARERCPEATLHFYGYGEKRAQMLEVIQDMGLQTAVFLHDFEPDIASVFESAGLMLCSSRNEGFCISVLEAIRHGCPVVAFDCHYGPGEIIQNGLNGFLCPPQDVDAMADAICQVLLDRALHQRLVDEAPASVASFAEDQMAVKWAHLLKPWAPAVQRHPHQGV